MNNISFRENGYNFIISVDTGKEIMEFELDNFYDEYNVIEGTSQSFSLKEFRDFIQHVETNQHTFFMFNDGTLLQYSDNELTIFNGIKHVTVKKDFIQFLESFYLRLSIDFTS